MGDHEEKKEKEKEKATERLGYAQKAPVKEKMISWVILVITFITFWYMLDIVLLTFVITFVFYRLLLVIQKGLRRRLPVHIPDLLILTLLYAVFIAALVLGSYALMPEIVGQMVEIGNLFMLFDVTSLQDILNEKIYAALAGVDFNSYIGKAGELIVQGITSVSIFGFNLFISLILSFLLISEKQKIRQFGISVSYSRISFIYTYLMDFGKSFVNTFGTVMQVQVIIATINTCISVICLTAMGFPQVLGLGIMIFCLGLIPVAGVIISMIPLTIIAFNLGGIIKVIEIVLMILAIHAFEAYVLNPKLMSTRMNLPVCFIFIILLVAEHYMGAWGLLIGTPIFIFLMSVLEINYVEWKEPKEKKSRRKKTKECGEA